MKRDEMLMNFDDRSARELIVKFVRALRGEHWLSIRRCIGNRTPPQNRFMHGVIFPRLAILLTEAQGETWDMQRTKDFLKARFLRRSVLDTTSGAPIGDEVRSTAGLDVFECSQFIEQCIGFGLEYFGQDVSEGFDDWKSVYCASTETGQEKR